MTHFDDEGAFDEVRYRGHLAWQADFDVAGLFAAGGTLTEATTGSEVTDDAVARTAWYARSGVTGPQVHILSSGPHPVVPTA